MIPATAEKEKELIEALRRGKSSAKRAFYEQFYRYLAAVCARYVPTDEDVKDLLQDVFLKIFNRFGSFEHRGPGSLQAWSRKIAVNEALQFLRDVSDIPQRVLLEMVRRLPQRYRAVFNLYIFEEKSHQEIAQLLQIQPGTSASNLHRAKALLSQWIHEYRKKQES